MAHIPHKIKKERENFIAKIIYRPLSEQIAMLLSKTSITPNKVSFISVVSSAIAGAFFSLGEWFYLAIGFIFLQLTLLLDHIDGNLARFTGTSNELGQWVDAIANKFHKFFFIFGASIGIFKTTGRYGYLLLGSAAIFSWFYLDYISETKTRFKFRKSLSLFSGSDRIPLAILTPNIFGLLVLVNKAPLALWFILLVSLISIKHIYSVIKQWEKEKKAAKSSAH